MASYESWRIGKLLSKQIETDAKIIDIGCGYGDKIDELISLGFTNVTGVEINKTLVDMACDKGLNVIAVDSFDMEQNKEQYDVLVMSHIIEHFQYQDLIQFMESYLGCLKQNGLLLIATPLMNPSFYDDFDHVKPYTHIGILSIFGGKATQVQYHSQHTLELIDLYYLRLAYQLKFYRTLEMHTLLYRIPRTINRLFHLIYRLSFRLIGQPKAWIGLFRKT
jgi:cyclopropane fatty-acyl-phospholipid synthase-like methyltransferase